MSDIGTLVEDYHVKEVTCFISRTKYHVLLFTNSLIHSLSSWHWRLESSQYPIDSFPFPRSLLGYSPCTRNSTCLC